MSSQNFVIKKGLTVDTTEVIDENAKLTTEAFGTEAEEKIQDVVGSLLNAGTGITLDYSDVGNSLTVTGNLGTITQVEAGTGLTGGGTAGHVTLNIGASTGITVNDNDIAVNMGDFTTDNLGEGSTNLYWTQSRFNTSFSETDTDALSEGTSNLYFTNERVDDRVASLLTEGSNITLTYDDVAGTLTISAVEDYLANNDTDDLSEGTTNLYFTNERVDDRVADLLTAGDNVTLTYDDTAGTLTIATAADITEVNAGSGLSGGGVTGALTLNVDYDDSSIGLDGSNKLAVKTSGITNDMLAGSIVNAKLVNSSVQINGTSVSLGGTITLDTDDIAEGSTNLYHTVERVQDIVGDQFVTNGSHVGISFAYDDANDGAIDATVSLTPFDTDNLSEGSTNLYFTNERVDDRVSALMIGGQDVEYSYDDVNGTLTLNHSNVTRTDDSTPTGTLTHEGTFVAVTGVTSSAQGHVTEVETTTFTLPAGAVPNDATITIAGGTYLETGGDFTTDQGTNETITIDHSATTRTDSTSTQSPDHEETVDVIDSVVTNATGHVTGVNVKTVTLPAGAVPNDGTLTVAGGTVLEVNVAGDSTFTADQAGASNITLDHSSVSRSDTTGTATDLDHEDTMTVVTGVTSSTEGHITAIETTDFTLPAGAVPNDASITISGGTDLETGGIFTTDQGVDETITIDHSAVTRSNTTGSATSLDHEDSVDIITGLTTSATGHVTGVETTTYTLPAGAVPNDATITISGGTDLETGGDFTTDQGTNETITIDHSVVARSNTTGTATSLDHEDSVDIITGLTTSATGHVTGVETTTYTLPAGAVPNNATITIEAGAGLVTGGDFTTDQGTNETITIDHEDTSTLSGEQSATDSVVTSVTVDGFGHVTAVGTDSSPSVENISTDWVDFVPMDTVGNPTPSQVAGRVFYHDEYKALTVYNDITGSSLQVGHEEWVRVYNNSGSTIANGTPVYVTGATGETPTVAPADATTELKSYVIGVATNDIANNSEGVATVRGLISSIDTSGLTVGSRVHLSASGGYSASSPTYPYFPVDLGTVVVSDATNGYIYVDLKEHHFESFRVTGNTHMDGNLTVDGDLTVNGTQSIVSQNNLAVADANIYLNSGDTIGEENTTFTGSGLDDAYFTGHYDGTTSNKTYYVRIDGVGTGTGGVDTFEWSLDNFSTTEATGVDITATRQELVDGIEILFNATTGHTSGDTWNGAASPVNVDTGWASNRNTGASGVGYTHMGVFFDVSDEKFKFYDEYDPEPEGEINVGDSSFSLGVLVADTFEGSFTGNLTGNVTGTATSADTLVGLTATIAELNILDGVTATASELNILNGVTATTAELNILDGVTATASELNILDGVTATASELNILDGVTATASELNILDGVTTTTTELNYVDGVTSNIQLQLDSKISAVGAGTGLSGGGTSGSVSLNLDFSELTDMTADISGSTELILQNGTTESRKAASEIKLSAFNNDLGNFGGFLTSESDTLDSVADRGASTNQTLTVGGITTSGNISADQITTSHTSNAGGVARNIHQSTAAPASGDGAVGDLWIVYA